MAGLVFLFGFLGAGGRLLAKGTAWAGFIMKFIIIRKRLLLARRGRVYVTRTNLVWYAPHRPGARPMARHPLLPQFKKYYVRADHTPMLMSTQPFVTSRARAFIHLTPPPHNHAVPTCNSRGNNVPYA